MRAQHFIFLLTAAGCAGVPQQPDMVLGQPAPRLYQPPAPPPVAAPAVAVAAASNAGQENASQETEEAFEHRLRGELAEGKDPAEAALALAPWLAKYERYDDAMAVTAIALEKAPDDPRLKKMLAHLQRSLFRRSEAADTLAGLCGDKPARELPPSVLFERAELECLLGRESLNQQPPDQVTAARHGASAQELVRSLNEAHAGHPWVVANAARIEVMSQSLAQNRWPPLIVHDVLAELRGNRDCGRRMELLLALCQMGERERALATAIAVKDRFPAIRAAAVMRCSVDNARALAELCTDALRDADGQVRRAGARRAAKLPPAEIAALLVPALVAESDPDAFTAMHDELSKLVPSGPELPFGGAVDAEVRRTVAAAWQKQWAQ
jgi:hypothetical protein